MSDDPARPAGRGQAPALAARTAGMFDSAMQHERAGRASEAEALYRQIVAEDPGHAGSIHRLGLLAARFGRSDMAIGLLSSAQRLKPADPVFAFDLANALLYARRAEEAAALYRRVVKVRPDLDEAHHNLGMALCALNDLDAAFAAIRDGIAVRARHAKTEAPPAPPYKTRHDREQLEYLIEGGIVDPAPFGAWRKRSPGRFQELFSGIHHLEAGARLDSPAIDPANTAEAVEHRWNESCPKLVVLDDFLTPKALDELRRFCLGSTIWERSYEGGYLGALAETGFACPLLAQIAAELRAQFPAILKPHALNQWWAFKYDSRLKGINLHADFAAVNLNFWITSGEASLDPEGNGLIVWDIAAPLDWDFETYNRNEPAARAFLAEAGAKPIVVPYRANRAVMFDSNLFHETAPLRFKDGYENRRINITFLYGWRG